MSEVIASKRIVITAEDRVTSVIAKTNAAFERLEQHLSQLGMKFNSGATEQESYKTALASTRSTVNETDDAIKKLRSNVDKLSGTRTVSVKAETSSAKSNISSLDKSVNRLKSDKPVIKPEAHTSDAINQLRRLNQTANNTGHSFTRLRTIIAGTAVGTAFGAGITAALSNIQMGIAGAMHAGIEFDMTMQQMNATWNTLTGSAGKAKAMSNSIVDLSNKLGWSVDVTNELAQQFYHVFDNQPETMKLTKSFLTMGDAIGLSSDRLKQVGMDFTHMLSSSKLQLGDLNQITDAFPMFGEALLKYERKVQHNSHLTMSQLRNDISAGKISAKDAEKVFNGLGDKYKKASENLMGTLPGMFRQISAKWKQLMGDAMAPTANAANPIVKQVSEWVGDKNTTKEFENLGKAVNNGVGSIMKALADNFGDGSVSKMLDNVVNGLTRFVKAASKWTANNAGSIVKTIKSLASIAGSIGKGAFDAIGDILKAISGTSGHGLQGIANALEEISKHKLVLNIIGRALATYFVYSKVSRMANGLLMVGNALGFIGKHKLSGNMFADFAKGINKLSKTSIDPKKLFKGGVNWARDLFKPLPSEALRTGDIAGGNFITRFSAKTNASRFAKVGRSLGGRIVSGVGLAIEAYDLMKDIHGAFTTHNGTTRSRDVGKAAGAGIGAGIGFFFGGPAGAALGGLIGRTIGGKIGPSVGKFGKSIGNVLNDIFVKHDWGKVWSTIGKGWQSFWKGMGNWWDQTIGKKGSSHSSKSKEPSQKEIKSLGGNHYSKTDIANIKQMNSAVRAYTRSLKELKSVVKKDDPTKQLRNMSKEFRKVNPAVKESAKYWKGLAKPLETSAKAFKVVDKALNTFKRKNNPMDRLNSSVQKLTKTVKKEQFGKLLAKQMQIADKSMSGKHSFVGQFEKMTKNVISELRRFRKSFDSDWKNTWTRLDSYPSRGLSRALSVVSSHLNAISSREHSFTSRFISSWRSWISNVVSAMRSGFDKLPGIAQRAMSGIVSRLNSGISAINAVISDFGGDKRLGSIHYARGTFFHPGGKAVLNDGPTAHKQELVWEPSRGFSLPQGQNTVHDLERGAMVLDAPHTDPLLNRMGIPHYAGGTLSEDEQDKIAQEFMDDPIKASRDLVLKVTNWDSSVPVIADLGKATAIGFSRGIANVLKDLLGIIKEPINGDWTPVIKSAARVLHVHIADWQISKLLRQIQTESGGNEHARQPGADPDGDGSGPALGLLQFKRSTFNNDAVGKYRDIWSGFDQLIAAIATLNRGGEGGWGNVGEGHGWATGGEITSQQFGWVGDNAQHHEFVINPYNSNALPLLTKAWTVMNANHPEWRTPTDSSYNSEMIALMKAAVASINSIDIHPRVEVEDVAKPINKYNAKRIGMMK